MGAKCSVWLHVLLILFRSDPVLFFTHPLFLPHYVYNKKKIFLRSCLIKLIIAGCILTSWLKDAGWHVERWFTQVLIDFLTFSGFYRRLAWDGDNDHHRSGYSTSARPPFLIVVVFPLRRPKIALRVTESDTLILSPPLFGAPSVCARWGVILPPRVSNQKQTISLGSKLQRDWTERWECSLGILKVPLQGVCSQTLVQTVAQCKRFILQKQDMSDASVMLGTQYWSACFSKKKEKITWQW